MAEPETNSNKAHRAKTCEQHNITPKSSCKLCENARKRASKLRHKLAQSSTTSATAA